MDFIALFTNITIICSIINYTVTIKNKGGVSFYLIILLKLRLGEGLVF